MSLSRQSIRARRNQMLAVVGLAVAVVAVFFGGKWLLSDRYYVSTDNAFVTGNLIPVHADATGVVVEALVEETQKVKKGDLILRLDEQRAGAALQQASSDLARAARAIGALYATRRQICEKVASRAASRDRARHDLQRYQQAAPSGSVSQQSVQNARDQVSALDADVRETRAELRALEARVGGLAPSEHPDVAAAKAKFLDAQIEFSRQRIRAPASGVIAKRKAQVGQRVKPGDQLMTIVPLDHLWIEANIWESRLKDVRPGQPVDVRVDLYGSSVAFHGAVEGLVPGSGAVFALLPPDNATGNFIHIVQRVPVRISLRADELEKHPLWPGLSTVATIDVGKTDASPVAALTRTSAPEYATDIYNEDIAKGKLEAERIVRENLARSDGAEQACAIGE